MKIRKKFRFVILLVLGLAFASFLLGEDPEPEIENGSTLVLQIGGQYLEATRAPWISRLLGERRRPFVGLLSTLAMAERDDRLGTVVIVIRPLAVGWGKVEELREAIGRLNAAGRKTVAYLDMAVFSGGREYFLASAASEIRMVPGGTVPVLGLAAEYFFLGGFWEMIGVEFDVAKAGRYKSAVEGISGKGMSEASREMANSLLDSTHQLLVSGIAAGRDLSRDQVLAIMDKGPAMPAELLSHNLIDGVEHLDMLLDRIGKPIVKYETYLRVDPAELGFEPVSQVALIYGTGSVVGGHGSRRGPSFASQATAEALGEAVDDPEIDAIILRIDSPGGSALASEQIWRSIMKARESGKPVIASFSDLAASGGYYAAVAADEIVSNEAALTGSIGVFAVRPAIGGGLGKLGIEVEALTRGRQAEVLLSSQRLSDEGRSRLQSLILETYWLFIQRVAAGRDLSEEKVDELAEGRVWTGIQAYERGLVDHLGGLHTAVARVRVRLDLETDADVALIDFPPPRSVGEEVADALNSRISAGLFARWRLPDRLERLGGQLLELDTGSPLLIPPFLIEMR